MTSENHPPIRGKVIDSSTRCVHYHSELDVIAIKFKCCGDFYPCHACHQETSGHDAEVWPIASWDERALLCGHCQYVMTIHEYLGCGYQCPACQGKFNPLCANHHHLYFDSDASGKFPQV